MANKSKEPIAFEDTVYEKEAATPAAVEQLAPPNATTQTPTKKEGQALPVTEPEVYQNQREFARGGLGRILNAYDTRLGRSVALKELLHKQGASLRKSFSLFQR
jgi:hypothetical protein